MNFLLACFWVFLPNKKFKKIYQGVLCLLKGYISLIMYHKPWAHLPGSKMAHLPEKVHICQVVFDTFAQKMAHLPGSKRAHMPGGKNIFLKRCLKEPKRPINWREKKCRVLPKRVKRGGDIVSVLLSIHIPYAVFLKA